MLCVRAQKAELFLLMPCAWLKLRTSTAFARYPKPGHKEDTFFLPTVLARAAAAVAAPSGRRQERF